MLSLYNQERKKEQVFLEISLFMFDPLRDMLCGSQTLEAIFSEFCLCLIVCDQQQMKLTLADRSMV